VLKRGDMRPKGSTEQLEQRRVIALRLLDEGKSYAAVAKIVGSSKSSVCRWNEVRQHPKRKTVAKRLGRQSKLTARQMKRLSRELKKGAPAHGYSGDYWTQARIADLIERVFEVKYSTSAIWYVMRRLGWSVQKPQKLVVQRRPPEIERWRRYVFPQLKKR
jgi:transposase